MRAFDWLYGFSPAGATSISKSVFTSDYQLFLSQLRQAREGAGVSQRELGRRLGRHHNFVSSCEMGDRVLNFVEVRAWCRALEISWLDFTRQLDEALDAMEQGDDAK